MSTNTPVRVGQVWADNDPRCAGRTLRVLEVLTDAAGHEVARLEQLTNSADDQRLIDDAKAPGRSRGAFVGAQWVPADGRGKVVTVKVRRMRPTSTGYRLVTDAPEQS
ncbi:hypothetical protein CHO01_36930 [Cellulomonas hominis]|uniref:Uncharacterized protein n=1 Tax=Cellulomonas hominis TaxID=156981 RepID=A0A511FJM5_9CELL|nr:hypothetical protein [Cellulomonas hominis]MBB5474723.1 hypothetical protein [Cellulomonas hominis]NKY05985.1 hypothetical protein [Cellulomonas hominis]GEL48577.1 hypothetical protein CHO01_36930 [Cellulomonas hominis]